jgi:transporter family protein
VHTLSRYADRIGFPSSAPLEGRLRYALLALAASVLTSLLSILNKQLLREARPALVAWAVNAASLPILAAGTVLLTSCTLPGGVPSCRVSLPQVDAVFFAALLLSAALNWAATLLSIQALRRADASLVTPLLTFNPAFTLLLPWLTLGERPGVRQAAGVAIILLGSYLLEVEATSTGLLAPIAVLLRRPGAVFAILASALWGITTVLEKLAIEHVTPPSGPLVALAGTLLTVLLLTPGAWWGGRRADSSALQRRFGGLERHPRAFLLTALLAGIAPLFGFTAIATGLVGYVTAPFKLSSVLTVVWARLFLGEGSLRQRLLGAVVMGAGGVLIVG